MKTRRQLLGAAWAVLCVCVLGANLGCGDDTAGAFAPGSFSAMHEEIIVFNCQQTVMCEAQLGTLNDIPDGEDPFENCQFNTADHLESNPDKQTPYLNNHNRCAQFTFCDYYNCARTGAATFGQTREREIAYDCQQRIACRQEQGEVVADLSYEMNNCVDVTAMALNQYTFEQQRLFDQSFPQCRVMTGCAYSTCMWGQ